MNPSKLQGRGMLLPYSIMTTHWRNRVRYMGALEEQEKTRIDRLWLEGYLRDKDKLAYLEAYLSHPCPDLCQAAARAIIEEVLGEENKGLRLRALERLKPFSMPDPNNPCQGQIDLHTHDFFSEDGYQTPSALALEAYEKGLTGVAVISHNQRYDDDEAERAAQILGIDLFKGGEIVSYVVLKDRGVENIHILQRYGENPPPEKLNEILRFYINRYGNELDALGYDLEQARNNPLEALKYLRLGSAQQLVGEKLQGLQNRFGNRLWLSQEELHRAKRGDAVYPFTIAVALWRKYREVFQAGFLLEEGKPESRLVLGNVNAVYQQFIRVEKTNYRDEGDERTPDLKSIATRAILLGRKLIIPHPSEYSTQAFEQILEDLALIELGGKKYAGTLIGVEYYSNKLRGKYKEYVREYIDKLNHEHPVYQHFPLYLLPGSDSHGQYSPDCPLGLGDNYPSDKARYKEEVYRVLKRPVIEFSTTELLRESRRRVFE